MNIDFNKMTNFMLIGLFIAFMHNMMTYNEVMAELQAVTPVWSLYMMDYITGPIAGMISVIIARKYYNFLHK